MKRKPSSRGTVGGAPEAMSQGKPGEGRATYREVAEVLRELVKRSHRDRYGANVMQFANRLGLDESQGLSLADILTDSGLPRP